MVICLFDHGSEGIGSLDASELLDQRMALQVSMVQGLVVRENEQRLGWTGEVVPREENTCRAEDEQG
jgi:hypothetical protein